MGKFSTLKDSIEEMRASPYEGETVGKKAKEGSKHLKEEFPSAVIINTVLAMRQKWRETAEPRLKKFKKNYPQVRSLDDLSQLVSSVSEEQFCKEALGIKITKMDFWRYKLLKELLAAFLDYKEKIGISDDWKAMEDWASKADVGSVEEDLIDKIDNAGLATVQNLRLCCGVDTSKPDDRVKNALRKIGLGNDVEIVELISELTGYSCAELDQIFWLWGESKGGVSL